ncbi:NAD(P)H-dependent flavin oxidoreductase [Saccharopolyspora mangrovi]|uniref:Nitronate monooxygenase n=1 Tax=Saccharopolyspora mangrovi TaxID=3082379 RepID=A0ABU6AGK7_9PSEU|nr:nitronate monooxygenase [Saccharopolyspora sp. S2-29]MEB3370529.1 nitronate monooxygenase [Saccharopolyspora sp. S2-29]
MIRTTFTQELGITHPIASAGMARVAQADLTAAVSEAGGLGCLGGSTMMPDELHRQIESIKARTSNPWAVNILLPESLTTEDDSAWVPVREALGRMSPEDQAKMDGIKAFLTPGVVSRQVEIILEARPAAVVVTFGTPKWFIDECRQRGITTMALVGSIGAARRADEDGVDILVAQGTEGGGHTGRASTLTLVPGVVDIVDKPVLAAGGIADGRGLAAALAVGAVGAWVGTRFVATPEAFGHQRFKERVVNGALNQVDISKAYSGKTMRGFRNEWTREWESKQDQAAPFPLQYAVAGPLVETGYIDGDTERGMMPAGQSVQNIHDIRPAGDVVREMSAEAERIVKNLGASFAP